MVKLQQQHQTAASTGYDRSSDCNPDWCAMQLTWRTEMDATRLAPEHSHTDVCMFNVSALWRTNVTILSSVRKDLRVFRVPTRGACASSLKKDSKVCLGWAVFSQACQVSLQHGKEVQIAGPLSSNSFCRAIRIALHSFFFTFALFRECVQPYLPLATAVR